MGYCTEIGLLSILFVPFAQCTCKNVKKFKVKGRPWKLLSSVVVNSHKLGLYTQVFHFFLSFCMSLLLLLWKKRKFIIHLLYRIKKVFWYITLSGTSFSSSYSSLFFLFLPFLFALNLNNIITEDGKKKIVREKKKHRKICTNCLPLNRVQWSLLSLAKINKTKNEKIEMKHMIIWPKARMNGFNLHVAR